jgi:predicted dehydrogenase
LKLEAVGLIGGGRWARVIVAVLGELLDLRTSILVASPSNAAGMRAWLDEQGFGRRAKVRESAMEIAAMGLDAAIVANAARDHEEAAAALLAASVPVLIEKPFALSAFSAQRLLDLAACQNVRIAPGLLFQFAPFIHDFAQLIAGAAPGHLSVVWTDPHAEERHGEPKRYDASIPVLVDVLPHVISIIRALGFESVFETPEVRVERGGAELVLGTEIGEHCCTVILARDAPRRQRLIVFMTPDENFELDFTDEPASIMRNGQAVEPRPSMPSGQRPLATMLAAFLNSVAGTAQDKRLRPEIALEICRVVDEILPRYRQAQFAWLGDRKTELSGSSSGVRYAVREMLTSRYPRLSLDEKLHRVAVKRLREWKADGTCGMPFDDERWTQTLASALPRSID